MVTNLKQTNRIKLAVIVGGHHYDVPGFRNLLDSIDEIDYSNLAYNLEFYKKYI